MSHKKIAKGCESKLKKDAAHYKEEAKEASKMAAALKGASKKGKK